MALDTKMFDQYMLQTYRLGRSEFAPAYDWLYLQLDNRGKKVGEAGVVQAGVFNQIMSMSATPQEAGNIIIKILRGQIGQAQAVTPQAPEPLPWDFGSVGGQQQQVAPPVHQPQPQYQTPAAPAFYQPDIPQQSPYATPDDLAGQTQGQHVDAPMRELLGDPNQMIPPRQDPNFDQAMQQAQMPPQQLQGQPGMDPGVHMPQNPPQVPANLQPPAGLQSDVFPISGQEESNPQISDAPF